MSAQLPLNISLRDSASFENYISGKNQEPIESWMTIYGNRLETGLSTSGAGMAVGRRICWRRYVDTRSRRVRPGLLFH